MHWKKFWKNLKKAKNNGVRLPVATAAPVASAAPVAVASATLVAPGVTGATTTPVVTATVVATADTGTLGVCVCMCAFAVWANIHEYSLSNCC